MQASGGLGGGTFVLQGGTEQVVWPECVPGLMEPQHLQFLQPVLQSNVVMCSYYLSWDACSG